MPFLDEFLEGLDRTGNLSNTIYIALKTLTELAQKRNSWPFSMINIGKYE